MKHVLRLLCLLSIWGLVGLTGSCTVQEEKPPWEVPTVITLMGGVIAPASPQDKIRMDSMEINFRLKTGSYGVDAVYQLFNTGEATTEWIGFPMHGANSNYISGPNDRVIRDLIRFQGWVNGRKELFVEKIPFLKGNRYPFPGRRLAGLNEETRWRARKIVFPKNAMTTVRIRYEAPYLDHMGLSCCPSDDGCFYLGPGQYWKGNITKAEIVFEYPEDPGFNLTRVHLRVGMTELSKKTITKTRITYELTESPLGNGYLSFTRLPESTGIRFAE